LNCKNEIAVINSPDSNEKLFEKQNQFLLPKKGDHRSRFFGMQKQFWLQKLAVDGWISF
jgi:hypothetical protein